MKWKGVFVATVTPFSEKGELAESAFRDHLRHLFQAGVQGIVACGTTGEGATLTRSEWERVLRWTVEESGNRPVIAGCGSNSTAVAQDNLARAKDLGCAAALVVTPNYNKPTQAGLLAHYRALADHSLLPFFLYNVPTRTSVHLAADTVSALFDHPQILGIKEASPNYAHWVDIARIAENKKKLLLAGDDDSFAVIGALGGAGIISASANVLPQSFVSLWNHLEAGRWKEAFDLQKALHPWIQALFSETNPAPVKYALGLLRDMPAGLRLPLVSIEPATAKRLQTVLSQKVPV